MKTLFKSIVTLLFGLMLLCLIWGFFLESKWEIQVTHSIKAGPADIFPYLNSLREWPNWTIWNRRQYPDLKVRFEGETSGPGAIQHWDDGNTVGSLRILESDPNRSLSYELTMEADSIQMQGKFVLQPLSNATEVRWTLAGDSGANPIARLMMLAYKPVIAEDLATNLQQLEKMLIQR